VDRHDEDAGAPAAALPGRPAGTGSHVVVRGECMASIAAETGHFWSTLWDHPDNATLRLARATPNVLLPGDRVAVPPIRAKWEACATGRRHTFRRRGVPSTLTIVLERPDGRPFAGKRYVLRVGAATFEGVTAGDGIIRQPVDPTVTRAELEVAIDEPDYPARAAWIVAIGALDPADSISGLQQRLNNLGFDCGPPDGALGPATRAALRGFQARTGIGATGEPDAATLDRLRREHGR
jgi:hypothetical protein